VTLTLSSAAWSLPLIRRATPASSDAGEDLGVIVRDVEAPQGPSMLTVRRTAKDDVQDRQVYLTLDGEEWATIFYGKEITREIAPGRHTLKANNTLVRKSVVFDVKPGEHVRYQCINKAHWTAMMFMAFLGAAFLTVKLVREKD
jgi:hypothetical protein